MDHAKHPGPSRPRGAGCRLHQGATFEHARPEGRVGHRQGLVEGRSRAQSSTVWTGSVTLAARSSTETSRQQRRTPVRRSASTRCRRSTLIIGRLGAVFTRPPVVQRRAQVRSDASGRPQRRLGLVEHRKGTHPSPWPRDHSLGTCAAQPSPRGQRPQGCRIGHPAEQGQRLDHVHVRTLAGFAAPRRASSTGPPRARLRPRRREHRRPRWRPRARRRSRRQGRRTGPGRGRPGRRPRLARGPRRRRGGRGR